jgi:hypothetical protein
MKITRKRLDKTPALFFVLRAWRFRRRSWGFQGRLFRWELTVMRSTSGQVDEN